METGRPVRSDPGETVVAWDQDGNSGEKRQVWVYSEGRTNRTSLWIG